MSAPRNHLKSLVWWFRGQPPSERIARALAASPDHFWWYLTDIALATGLRGDPLIEGLTELKHQGRLISAWVKGRPMYRLVDGSS